MVTDFEQKGLTKSAAEQVDVIYNKAKSQNIHQQVVKALLFKSKYGLILEENAQLKIVEQFKSEIETTTSLPTKHLLENILATMYWQYFQQNRYKFYQRSQTAIQPNDDFRTWDLKTLFNEIHSYYQRSLRNGILLQQERLTDYKALLVEAKNSKDYRPTLFDLLSHNALNFYQTDENSITQPAQKFVIADEAFLSPSKKFINLNIASEDSTSLQLNALKIYQSLLRFHSSNPSSLAFVNSDIERLRFVYQNSVNSKKTELLLSTLKESALNIESSEQSSLYNFEIAKVLKEEGNKFNSQNQNISNYDSTRWKLKEAYNLCTQVIKEWPNSPGAKKCEALKDEILYPELQLQAETFIPVSAASRVLVNYRNLNEFNLKIFKVTKKQLNTYNSFYNTKDRKGFIDKLRVYNDLKSSLKNEGDFQNHSTELIIPSLPNGLYLLKAETPKGRDVFATAHIQVTDFALIENRERQANVYQLINRSTGMPIANAEVQIKYYNNSKTQLTKKTTSNTYGKFYLDKDDNYYRRIEIQANYDKQTAYFGQYSMGRKYKKLKQNKYSYNTFLFTDRSLYRPGQVVYFKGIVTETLNSERKTRVLDGENITTTLHNVNGDKLGEIALKTNDFGSVHGEFILPVGGLTGQFYIKTQSDKIGSGFTYFSVEEYKRPKFEVEFEPITQTFKINNNIKVTGKAIAFAGNNITNAKVAYRVKRQVQFPSWYYWRNPYWNSAPQEITFGETKTNEKGEFELTFKAIPDSNAPKENLPVFRYEVTADITDINGETHSASRTVNVGYHAMTLNLNVKNKIDKNSHKPELEIIAQNLNGERIPANGLLSIYKLSPPKTVLRPRPWRAPDYQVLPKDEFKALFPHDAYKNEHLIQNWNKGKKVFSRNFNTQDDNTIVLKRLKKWPSGKYIIEVKSTDKFGQQVEEKQFISIYDDSENTLADNTLFEAYLDKVSYTNQGMAKLTLGTAAKDLTITVEIEKNNKIIATHRIDLNNQKKTLDIPILKSDLGGFVVHCSFAAYNSYNVKSLQVNVPYPKTELSIETKTFRDKLQPGSEETWSFSIKGPKSEKVTAELLASMYDASLDEFLPHSWDFNPILNWDYYSQIPKRYNQSFGLTGFRFYNSFARPASYQHQSFDHLNWFGFYFDGDNHRYLARRMDAPADGVVAVQEDSETPIADISASLSGQIPGLIISTGSGQSNLDSLAILRGTSSIGGNKEPLYVIDGEIVTESNFRRIKQEDVISIKILKPDEAQAIYGKKGANGVVVITTKKGEEDLLKIKVRKNLQETAFFFPQLQTDSDGNVSFNFTAPEALTKWKLQLLAHTKNLKSTVGQYETITQKELMVIPNAPRFLREGDEITISAKIANLTDKSLNGISSIQLSNALTGTNITSILISEIGEIDTLFSVDAKGNTQVSWHLKIPDGIEAIQYKVIAKTKKFSDGEQNVLPVLTNRILVTEALPMWIRSNQQKTFTLDKLTSNTSVSLKYHRLTLELTSNPAWYAIQVLPYLMEFPYDCNEQIFARYYANALARHIVSSNPKIEAVFKQWNSKDALISNLEKNQDLKAILIQETPWLRDAQSESEQKKRIGLLFDLNKVSSELQFAQLKLRTNQQASGAWSWFNGGYANRYITQHIVAGFGHLKHLGINQNDNQSMIQSALNYLDKAFVKEFNDLKKQNDKVDLNKDQLSYMQLHYLYTRSFYPELKPSKEVEYVIDYYKSQIESYWLKRSLYAKGLMALTMHRMNSAETANAILKSIEENSVISEELGMYWKENGNSWHWYKAPIETQALLIEAFAEIKNDPKIIDNLKIWLLRHKQTNTWKTTKATTEAVYALLLQGSNWLSIDEIVKIEVGGELIVPETRDDVAIEAGTGYFKTTWPGSEIEPKMGNVTLANNQNAVAWGALYWQYFEDLDKITPSQTPLNLSKKLYLKSNSPVGEVISEITPETNLTVGDLIKVRIELRTDRPMEFIHLKDMRAAGLEPINVLSQYKWQDGLGYYESTKDAATNFFIDFLPKGIYVFEYDLRVNNAGQMSNGISTVQSMYAPEFSSHSEGLRIKVEN
ncbi:alpha-2-macroglobulin [Winogradskyella sp. DF17]|uniref:Alpha-2-macroglobulin n=2 Tax=Winogradskyella pelagia TaxID=2819984 RepID=A0ABS3T4A6_9FLAO|nr:alpha-2-macroglobulin [Winogradskyella sp. DF17]